MKPIREMVVSSPPFWVEKSSHGCWHTLKCSECGFLVNIRKDYRNPVCCPGCGEKMINGGI